MWILESDKLFLGRRLWLRPGTTYLFGRTPSQAGQIIISNNTISRKHLTITVDKVTEGASQDVLNRTRVVIEDLVARWGTLVDGESIKGSKHVVSTAEVSITMGKCPEVFRVKWVPIVFTFSFTNRELQAQPMKSIRERCEQLDIKLLLDYDTLSTTHVFSKKRNTAKGLQALVSGRFIVTESFLDAISAVTDVNKQDPDGPSLLEEDFDKYWPDPMEHLPPQGNEPAQHPDDIYKPDLSRSSVFEGYTFIFYDQAQYQNLMAPITSGSGKALLRAVEANTTTVEDFVRYVKQVAGEKGLGSFDDGSEGRGVVLVRFLPAKGDLVGWYTDFLTNVSLRLDHRPIEQNEFLEAILIKDASRLRRPLEVESSMADYTAPPSAARGQTVPVSDVSQTARSPSAPSAGNPSPESQAAAPARRFGYRKQVVKRFVGFNDSDDNDTDMSAIPLKVPDAQTAPRQQQQQQQQQPQAEEDGLFVSQEQEVAPEEPSGRARTQGKRTAKSIPEEDDLMEGLAPAVAKFKRQRLDEAFAPPSPEPEPEPEKETDEYAQRVAGKGKGRKARAELDVLAVAAKNREEAEARARAEQEDLAYLPEGIDLAEIRRLNIVEEIEVRAPGRRARDDGVNDDDDDGDNNSGRRWNPKWNGVKNFKKFRRRGEVTGRQPARIIVPLAEAKNKEFGVGDNYWLEEKETRRARREEERAARRGERTTQPTGAAASSSSSSAVLTQGPPLRNHHGAGSTSHSSDGEAGSDIIADEDGDGRGCGDRHPRQQQQQQHQRDAAEGTGSHRGKRAVGREGERDGPPAKRTRGAGLALRISDEEDDSDDELKFRFGKRR